ncbi:MAG: TIM barrel protein [Candidatus Hydrogenedentota bacterium]
MHTMTRRNFLKATGASVAALGLTTSGIQQVSAAKPYGKFRMGVQSYTYRNFLFNEAMQKISDLGLHHVELFSGHLDHTKVTPKELKEVKKRLKDLGLQVDACGVNGFSRDEKAARVIFEFGKALGMRSLSADPAKSSFDMLDKLVEEYDIPIAIHNHGPSHQWGKPEVILEAIKDHHPLIGLCADTGHFLRADVDPVEAIKILKGRVFGLHVKDFVSEHEEAVAGDGKLDLKALFTECMAQGFKGACSIEFELDPEDPTAGVEKGLVNIREAIASL